MAKASDSKGKTLAAAARLFRQHGYHGTALHDILASDLEKSNFSEGCPIATTALETAAQSDVLGAATRGAFQKWETEIKRGLERFGMSADEADLVATLVLSQLEGALLLARTYRSLAPMQRAELALKGAARGRPAK